MEKGRWLKDPTLLLDRNDAYVDLGPGDSPSLPKRERKDRYYSGQNPKYWIDHYILVEWLICGKSTILEECSNAKFQDWYLKEHGREYEVKWLIQEDVEKLIGHIQSFPLTPQKKNLYQKELKEIKHFVWHFLNQFSYKDTKGRTRNYFFKSVGEKCFAGEMQLFIAYLSWILARYKTLLFVRDQLYKKIDWMMNSRKEKEKLQYHFGALIKVTYRKNDVLLKALCYKIDQLTRSVTYPDRLLKVIPFILSKLDIFPPEITHKKRDCKTDRRKLCSNIDCFDRKVKSCLYSSPTYFHDFKVDRKEEELECIKERKTLCNVCENAKKSPFRNLCPQGAERFNYFVRTAKKSYAIQVVSFKMQWIARNNLREVNERCPFCNMKLFQYYFDRFYCLTCESAFPFSGRNNLHIFKDKKPTSTISLPV